MSFETLQACHHFLTEQQAVLYNPKDLPIVTERLQLLRGEIELRRMEARSDQQDGQVIGLGRKTLFWAEVGGIAGAIATIVLLLYETPLSKLLPSTVLPASPNLLAAIDTKPRALTNSHVSRVAVSYTDNLTGFFTCIHA